MSEKKRPSVEYECEECAAELIITVRYAPPFKDFAPLCPFCQHPLTRESKEETVKLLEAALAAVKEGEWAK